nr:B76 [uncultured bacterium]
MDELYDLNSDPYELKNLINEPNMKKALDEMKEELQRFVRAQ